MITNSAIMRTQVSKSLTQKSATKASVEEDLDMQKGEKSHKFKELAATLEYINSLHMECDWLLKILFEVRKEAMASEIDELRKAKAILSRAEYYFLETAH